MAKTYRDIFHKYEDQENLMPGILIPHIVVVGADFTEEQPLHFTEYLAYADEQIKRCKRWAEISQKTADGKKYSFPWHTVEGNILVKEMNLLK